MISKSTLRFIALLLGVAALCAAACAAPQLTMLFPLGRSAYQTDRRIDVSVVRSDTAALPADTMTLTVTDETGGALTFTYPVAAIAVTGADARTTEHYHLNGWLLRPGPYTLTAAANGATAQAAFLVHSHVRQSSYRLIYFDMGPLKANEYPAMGEEGMGFNFSYGQGVVNHDGNIRGGLDAMHACSMGGGHQIDLRLECDWSDPYVLHAAVSRVTAQALRDRTQSDVIGVHFYDEPGLTWINGTPHAIPAQKQSYQSAFGFAPINYTDVNPQDPAQVAQWKAWGRWKLAFLPAAFQLGRLGVALVNPHYLTANQSQYGYTGFTDGYYYNVDRGFSVVSGHGGYDDIVLRTMCPVLFLDMARARDRDRSNWYCPTWFNSTPSDNIRLENNSCFATGIQGIMTPPPLNPMAAAAGRQGVAESNRLYARLGPIFTTLPRTPARVALLYSLSDLLDEQAHDIKNVLYAFHTKHGSDVQYAWLAGRMCGRPFDTVMDEDVIDGSVLANYRAIFLTHVTALAPAVVTGLEQYIAKGGAVLMTKDSTVTIKGATVLTAEFDRSGPERIAQLRKEIKKPRDTTDPKVQEVNRLDNEGGYYRVAAPVATELAGIYDKLGIAPLLQVDSPYFQVNRHADGDIKYLFATNFTHDDTQGACGMAPEHVNITFPNDGKTVYDAVRMGPVAELQGKHAGTAAFSFGAGAMRVFARTARPIGGVQVATPTVIRSFEGEQAPVRVNLTATLVDTKNVLLAGSAPLDIQVCDPQGAVRYDLYRATAQGVCQLTLPLALNDPAGSWTVTVRELLSGQSGAATFTYTTPGNGGAIAGATPRAVFFEGDRDTIFRFFRTHKEITLVKGTDPIYDKIADRLAATLKPWDVRCTIVSAAEITPRVLTPEEAATWTGMAENGRTGTKPGGGNSPNVVGYNLGNAVLIGTPADNSIIKMLESNKVLPYPLSPDFPGHGHGLLAWTAEVASYGYEAVALIGYDEAGLQEAAGTLYEIATGLTPVTPLTQPASATFTAGMPVPAAKAWTPLWHAPAPDRVIGLQLNGNTLTAMSYDGTVLTLSAQGAITAGKPSRLPTCRHRRNC